MYRDVSQMYLKCSVLFEENTYVILHVFGHVSQRRVKDTFEIHVEYIKIHVSWAIPWCHTGYVSGYIQDTSQYMYLGTFIKIHDTIHRDTKSRYMYLRCKIHAGYMRDRDAGYMYLQGDQDMWDTSKTLMRYMYLKLISNAPRWHTCDVG